MKICLFADAQSVHIRQLTHHLAGRGHKMHVITNKPAQLPCATVERFSVPAAGLSNFHRWEGRRRKYLREILSRFDVVNVHFLADWNLEEVLADREPDDARIVVTAWGSDIVDPPGENPASADLTEKRKTLLHHADAVTTCGSSFASTVAQFAQIPVERIHIVPFGVDLSLFNSAIVSPKSDGALVGFFKGFRPVYGPTVLVRAIPPVLRTLPDVRFEMIGDGVELARCQALASELGVSHAVTWSGRLDHSTLPRHIGRWRLSVIPSLHEAFGVAALESQAMRVPIIASRVGGLVDTVVDRETGLLFRSGDSQSLANAITALLSNPPQLEQMGVAGSEFVRRDYDWTQLAARWEQLYESVRERAFCTV